LKTSDFDYHLPAHLIAQSPLEPRDSSRLMVMKRQSGVLEHRHFDDITEYLAPGDLLVMNDSRVIPARIFGTKAGTGVAIELLLLRHLDTGEWEALAKPAKKLAAGSVIDFETQSGTAVNAIVTRSGDEGIRHIRFSDEAMLDSLGEMPLPPYIHARLENPERYQTVYARDAGSAAAPTAGLHFTPGLLGRLDRMGVECLFNTLHIGLDTFRPVQVEDPTLHHIHHEYGVISFEVAGRISAAKKAGRRVICVGTTSVRLLEYAALHSVKDVLDPFAGWVDLLILPGYRFQMADAMITNFHLPRSTLLMMVSAFAGEKLIKDSYAEAVSLNYRFYSFGDAMLII